MNENTASGSLSEIRIDPDILLLLCRNDTDQPTGVQRNSGRRYLQFHFCLKGQARFAYNEGRYHLDLPGDQSLLLYNPQTELPVQATLSPHTWVVSVLMSIRTFHGLFSSEADYIPFLNPEYRDRKYYQQNPVGPSISVVLSQLWGQSTHPSVRPLYYKAKVYELLSLYFNRTADPQAEQCPFLLDEENLRKIRLAKEIVIERMAEPPTLPELAEETGLSLKKLKEGFKQIYGDTVYSFLFDYKMETARKMLESGTFNVNEVGLKVGYSTASHFISAFKKKYNTTPKKYLMSLA
ncbi:MULTISPECIES: helix-turn-helix transcriptional regulator [Robiginitalea]|uniref:Transcriptional regulator n=1 Tax=Robiginitalea biformata (strain ATCC BAA-864 / DSM 15991 / KCTC 12146 / HTCC2501) TaxID=313596 RepID=A4CHM5_ROBBH|nr:MULTISPECIES: AraC family transcriptional regulator [Robiginitalea]EAR16433.1 transcriptional regulator [Robiginitalea biformata HTCC2501]MDC6353304.1 AraC family transcriptional regulator [Robiginitalea sp. PM2]MDC6373531.1 AraC family transcriptional regulator [Robiginitalea sp. SP8]